MAHGALSLKAVLQITIGVCRGYAGYAAAYPDEVL